MTDSSGIFEIIFNSTKDFHTLFGNFPPDEKGQVYAFNEEVKEFLSAVGQGDEEAIAEEAMDVVVTVCSVLMAKGVSREKLLAVAEKVAKKNRAKTSKSHKKDETTNKIRRKTAKELVDEFGCYTLIPLLPEDIEKQTITNSHRNKKLKLAITEDNKHVLAIIANTGYSINGQFASCMPLYQGGIIAQGRPVNVKDILMDVEKIDEMKRKYSLGV